VQGGRGGLSTRGVIADLIRLRPLVLPEVVKGMGLGRFD